MHINYRVKGDLNILIAFDHWSPPAKITGPNLRVLCEEDRCLQGCPSKTGFCSVVDTGLKRTLVGIEEEYADKPLTTWQLEQVVSQVLPLYLERFRPYGERIKPTTLNLRIEKAWRFITKTIKPSAELEAEFGLEAPEIQNMPPYWTLLPYDDKSGYDYVAHRDMGLYWKALVRKLITTMMETLITTYPIAFKTLQVGKTLDFDFVRYLEKQVWEFARADYKRNYEGAMSGILAVDQETEEKITEIDEGNWNE